MNADAARPKHSEPPWISGVSIPINRTLPTPESRMVSPSVTEVT